MTWRKNEQAKIEGAIEAKKKKNERSELEHIISQHETTTTGMVGSCSCIQHQQ